MTISNPRQESAYITNTCSLSYNLTVHIYRYDTALTEGEHNPRKPHPKMTSDPPTLESASTVAPMSPNTTPVKSGIGLGLLHPSSSSSRIVTPTSESVLTTYPHLGHYIFTLLASIQTSPPRSSQHPLSVSSSSESDEERSPPESRDENDGSVKDEDGEPRVSSASAPVSRRVSKADPVDKDGLVRRVVELLDEEMEEEVKEVLKPHMGDLGKVSCIDLHGSSDSS